MHLLFYSRRSTLIDLHIMFSVPSSIKCLLFGQCIVLYHKIHLPFLINVSGFFNGVVSQVYHRPFNIWTVNLAWCLRHSVPSHSVQSCFLCVSSLWYLSSSCLPRLALACLLSHAVLGSALCCWWLCAGGSVCCLLCGGLRDEDQYLLRHSSPALDHDSPCGQHMLLAHLEHQDKEQLQCTLARLENENRSVARKNKPCFSSLELGSFLDLFGWCLFSRTRNPSKPDWLHMLLYANSTQTPVKATVFVSIEDLC